MPQETTGTSGGRKTDPALQGPRGTGDLQFQADSWDGPHFRPFGCGINDYISTPPPHAMFMDAMEPQGCWEYVLMGTVHYRVGSERHRVEAGEALVTRRPDPGWMLRPVKGTAVQTLWINVTGEMALRMFDYLHIKFGQIQHFPRESRVVRLARQLVHLVARQPKRPAHFWSEKTFHFMNAWWTHAQEGYQKRDRRALEAIEPSRLISYAPRSVKNFATEMGYSRAYLTRKLSQQWQRPPGRVLREVRLQDAASLLRTTRLTISEISTKVGYSTAASFSRAFLKHYHQSPRDYRNDNR